MKINQTLEKNLNLLRDVHLRTQTPISGKLLNLDLLVRKHSVNTCTPTIIRRELLKAIDGTNPSMYQWNSIQPNVKMAEKLIEEVKKYQSGQARPGKTKEVVQTEKKIVEKSRITDNTEKVVEKIVASKPEIKQIIQPNVSEFYTIRFSKRSIRNILVAIKYTVITAGSFIAGFITSKFLC